MTDYTRDFRLLHPLLIEAVTQLVSAVSPKLPAGTAIKPISGHRSPAEQFEIFKKGRRQVNGHWEKVGVTCTNKDGFELLSYHNYLPSLAVDFGLFKQVAGREVYIEDGNAYRVIGPIAESIGFEWGGRWTSPFDPAHVQVSANRLIGQSLARGSALVWQDMLHELGFYNGELDGYFGKVSAEALGQAVGELTQTPGAYLKLLAAISQKRGLL